MKMFDYEKKNNYNEEYLFHLQKFIDIVENIEDVNLKNRIVAEMTRCNDALMKKMEELPE